MKTKKYIGSKPLLVVGRGHRIRFRPGEIKTISDVEWKVIKEAKIGASFKTIKPEVE